MLPLEIQESELAETANAPFPWLIFARRLVQSAYLLDSNSEKDNVFKDVRNVARMCMGMAIEGYLKAFYVASGNKIHDGKKQARLNKGHDLTILANDVNFQITPAQQKVLYYLSGYISIKGRYPTPIKLENMKLHNNDLNAHEEFGLRWDPEFDDVCNELIKLLETQIDKVRRDRV
jgi:hypothetical protein